MIAGLDIGGTKCAVVLGKERGRECPELVYRKEIPTRGSSGDILAALTEELKKQFDYIIYDTPPVELVSDALALVPITDGALLVCRYMRSYESDIKSSLDTLRFAKANVLGMVVNDFHVNPKKLKKNQQKYYYSYYSYGYGEADPEKDSKITKKVPPPAVFLNK